MKTNIIDRLPPHSIEVEQALLGCQLLAPNDCVGLVIEKLGVEALYDLRHQTIQKVITAMYDQRDPIDLITVQQKLKDANLLDSVGGITYLNAVQDAAISPANLTYFLDIISEKHQLRKMIQAATGIVSRAYDFSGEIVDLLDQSERDILAVRTAPDSGVAPIRNLVQSAIGRIEEKFHRKGALDGLATGFPDLDRMTDGLKGGEMIVVAARPSIGKTSLAMNIAEHVALNLKQPVGVFSLEMSADQLMMRAMCSNARVNLRNIREGFMSEADFPKLTAAAGRFSSAPLFIDDTGGLSIMQLRSRARRLWQQHGIKLFVVDYLQLLHGTSRKAEDNRQHEIAEISGGIKSLAKELNVPILVCSQLNREMEKTKGRKPRLSDLRESGAIEQDADLVGLLYKPGETEAEQNDESDAIPVNLLIGKQRNGPTGDVNLTFLKCFTRFESAAKVSDEDVPDHPRGRSPHKDA